MSVWSSLTGIFRKAPGVVGIPKDALIEKAGRGVMPKGVLSGLFVRNGLLQPAIDQVSLFNAYINSWMLQAAVNKVVEECTKEGGDFEPKFSAHCDYCNIDYDEYPERGLCEECGQETREPDRLQLVRVKEVFERPTVDSQGFVDKTFADLLKESMTYNQVIGDCYWEVVYSLDGQPAEFWPLTSEYIRRVEQGKEVKFCPYCFSAATKEKSYPYDRILHSAGVYGVKAPETKCRKCNSDLKTGVWMQVDDNLNVVAMWAEEEIAHWSTRAFGTRIYSIPKTYAVWAVAQILRYQELYQWSTYSQNRMPHGALSFPGMSQEKVNELFQEVAEWKRRNPNIPRYLILGAQDPPVWVDFTLKFSDLEAKEMALFYREAIAIVYGVSLQMLGVQTPGKLGKETEVVEVSYDTIMEVQTQFNEFINTKIIPRFTTQPLEGGKKEPLVTDWVYRLKSPKRDDEMRKAQIISANIDILQKLKSLGVRARLTEDMTEVVADWETYDPDKQIAQAEQTFAQTNEMMRRLGQMKPGETVEIPDETSGNREGRQEATAED